MKKCISIEDGVKTVLEIYDIQPKCAWEYIPAADGDLTDTIRIDGVNYPLFWWRSDAQIRSLYEKAPERRICSMKLNRTCTKRYGIDRLTYQEMDIAEFVMHSKIKSLMCFDNGCARNILTTMENETVAVFELASVLNDQTNEQGRHTYWGQDGMASDRVVSQKIPSESIYLFTDDKKDPEVFNDIFIYMYGMNKTDIVKAACISEILMGWIDISDWKEKDAHYRQCLDTAYASAKACMRMAISEV